MSLITVQSNLTNIASIDTANTCLGTPHSYSLLSLCMLDLANKDLNLYITFQNESSWLDAFDQITYTLLKCISNKVWFRSCFHVDKSIFLDTLFEKSLTASNSIPTSSNDYPPGIKVIMDISYSEKNIVYKFYRWNDAVRTMQLICDDSD